MPLHNFLRLLSGARGGFRRKQKKRGVGTVIATLFFVLIALILFGVVLSIFNSFQNYANTYKAYNQQNLINQSTNLAIPGVSFMTPVPTSSAPSTVGTSTSKLANSYSDESKLVFAQGLWWDFYSSGSALVYRTSSDGNTWSGATTITSSSGSNLGYDFAVVLNGNTIYYVLTRYGSSNSFRWRYGTLQSAGTISWSISETSVTTSNTVYSYVSIAVDTSGNFWVAVNTQSSNRYGSDTHIEVWRYNGASWSKVLDYDTGGNPDDFIPILVELTSGKMALLYEDTGGNNQQFSASQVYITTYSSGSWSSSVSPQSNYDLSHSFAIAAGDTVEFAGLTDSNMINFWTYAYGAGSTSTETTVENNYGNWYTTISQANANTLVIYYGSGSNMYFLSSTNQGASWSSRQTISTSENSIAGITSSPSAAGISWTSGGSSPYNVRFAFLSFPTPYFTISLQANNPFAVHFISLYMYDVNSSSLVAHYDQNASAPGVAAVINSWVSNGNTVQLSYNFNWAHSHVYLFTATTDQGVLVSANYKSPV